MMHSIDMEYRLLNINECWTDVMGYEPKEVIGRNAMELFTEDSRRHQMEVTRPEAIRTGEFNNVPLQMINKSGEIVDVLLTGVAITDDDGDMIYSVSFLIDVTEQNRTERERRTLEMKALSSPNSPPSARWPPASPTRSTSP